MRVNLSDRDVGMSKQFLHFVEGNTILHKPTCKGVPERMKVQLVIQLRKANVVFQLMGYSAFQNPCIVQRKNIFAC